MSRERMLSRSIFRFTETPPLWNITEMLTMHTAVSVKGSLAVSTRNSNPDPRWFLESSFEVLSNQFRPVLYISLRTSNATDKELSIFKSSLFISLIKCPIVNPFNYKLLTTLSCPFFVIVRAVAGADWSAKLIKENDTDESRFSKQTSTAHGDNFGGIYD